MEHCKEYIKLSLRLEELKPLVIEELRGVPSGSVVYGEYVLSSGLSGGWWRFSDDLFEKIAKIEQEKELEIQAGKAYKYNQTDKVRFRKKKQVNEYKKWVDEEIKKSRQVKLSEGFDTSKK